MEVMTVSKLEELIQEFCPDGVECFPLWSVTTWDKRFSSYYLAIFFVFGTF